VTAGVLLLGGPTASGKTGIALDLAQRFGGEIVGADSRQIYAGMPVGTAAPDAAALRAVPHHLVGFLDPRERYSAARFAADALAAIDAIHARGRHAIVVGGTGFYLRALAGDVGLSRSYDEAMRSRLAREALVHPPDVLHDWLRSRDPQRAAAIDPHDRYRVGRALEISLAPAPAGPAAVQPSLRTRGFAVCKLWLDVPIEVLERRIEARTRAMLDSGLIEEAERVGPGAVAADAVGYSHVFAYLRGLATRSELLALLRRDTRRYAKRQRTWFRGEPSATAIEASDPSDAADRIAAVARERLAWN
jgi:tRNA dimethylallyltransferase